MDRSLQLNRTSWDERAPLHAASKDYEVELLVERPAHLSETVRFDLPLLGDIHGLNAVHLQCHIGTDTLSLARLGAQVCGLDYSAASLAQARALAERCAAPIAYVESDVYAADQVLPAGTFDLVYTGIGALCWLPRIDDWARVVATLLKPGGRLFLREGHPILWSMDETQRDDLHLRYPYFEQAEPLEWDDDSSYVATDRPLTATKTYEWNHGIGEIVTALLDAGLVLTMLMEHDSVPWEALPGQMLARADGEYALDERAGVAPLSYTIQAVKPL
jgi:SAM-dependent methyltransferase